VDLEGGFGGSSCDTMVEVGETTTREGAEDVAAEVVGNLPWELEEEGGAGGRKRMTEVRGGREVDGTARWR